MRAFISAIYKYSWSTCTCMSENANSQNYLLIHSTGVLNCIYTKAASIMVGRKEDSALHGETHDHPQVATDFSE